MIGHLHRRDILDAVFQLEQVREFVDDRVISDKRLKLVMFDLEPIPTVCSDSQKPPDRFLPVRGFLWSGWPDLN
jgi:hypothetical protein